MAAATTATESSKWGIMKLKWFWMGVSCCVLSCGILQAQEPASLNSVDKQFLKMAADADMMEVHAGKMAEAQASNEAVKDFGKTLEQDHTKSYNELAVLAKKTGASIPKGIDIGHDQAMQQLVHLQGKKFDRMFVHDEIQDHQKTIAAFEREAKQGQNPELQSYAQQSLPVLEKHLRKAQMLAASESLSKIFGDWRGGFSLSGAIRNAYCRSVWPSGNSTKPAEALQRRGLRAVFLGANWNSAKLGKKIA